MEQEQKQKVEKIFPTKQLIWVDIETFDQLLDACDQIADYLSNDTQQNFSGSLLALGMKMKEVVCLFRGLPVPERLPVEEEEKYAKDNSGN